MIKADFFFFTEYGSNGKKVKGRTIVSSALTLEQGSNVIYFSAEHREH